MRRPPEKSMPFHVCYYAADASQTLLEKAIAAKDKKMLKELVEGAENSLSMWQEIRKAPFFIHKVVRTGDVELVSLVLQACARLYDRGYFTKGYFLFPLEEAVKTGSIQVAKLLLEAAQKVGIPLRQLPLLHAAAEGKNFEVTEFLLKEGFDVDGLNCYGETPLVYLVRQSIEESEEAVQMAAFLIKKGASVVARDSKGFTALHYAARNGNNSLLRLLLAAGAVPGAAARYYFVTPLMYAAERLNLEAVRMLVEEGADLEALDREGCGALEYALRGKKGTEPQQVERVVSCLLEAGARARWPLTVFYAVTSNQAGALRLLLKNLGLKGDAAKTGSLFIKAVAEGNLEAAEVLLEYGADVNSRDESGESALIKAIKLCRSDRRMIETVRFLLERGAAANAADAAGKPPLFYALEVCDGDISVLAEMMVRFGADVNFCGWEGLTPLEYLSRLQEKQPWQEKKEAAAVLFEAGAVWRGGGPLPPFLAEAQEEARRRLIARRITRAVSRNRVFRI